MKELLKEAMDLEMFQSIELQNSMSTQTHINIVTNYCFPVNKTACQKLGKDNNLQTCFKIQHLNQHECDVDSSNSKWVLPHSPVTFLLAKKILEGFLHKARNSVIRRNNHKLDWDCFKHIYIYKGNKWFPARHLHGILKEKCCHLLSQNSLSF